MYRIKSNRVIVLCLVLLFFMAVLAGIDNDRDVYCNKVAAAGEVFTFNGKNLSKFNGEKTFIINCNTTAEHLNQIEDLYEKKYKKFSKVTKVEYGPKATKVKEGFLIYFTGLKKLVLGKNIKQFPEEKWDITYMGYPLLDIACEWIEVKKGNNKYVSKDGVLYNKDMTTLIKMPSNYKAKSYVMPDTVQGVSSKEYSITFGGSLEQITISRVFNGNLNKLNYFEKLKWIDVVEGNPHFCTMDGVLYNQAQTKMICWPAKNKATQVKLPDTLTRLDVGYMPDTLEQINIPRDCKKLYFGGVEYEDSNLFYFMKKLKEITVSPGNTSFQSIDGVLYSLDGVTLIAYPAAKPDKEFVIPDDVVTIADDAVTDKCINLTRLVIGKRVKYWDCDYSEYGLPEVEEYVVAPDNLNFSSENGVLYTKDKKELLAYPKKNMATSFVIPKEVEEIDTDYFESDYLTTITIESSKLSNVDFYGLNGYTLPKLEAFVVTAGNKFKVVDGVLYSNKGTLLSYPAQKKDAVYTMPDFVKQINPYSIIYNPYLKKIVLGKKVKGVDSYSMGYGCKNLTAYKVNKKNKHFSVKDGILYNKKKTHLKMYPFGKKAKTLVILKSVKSIDMYSRFLAQTALKQFKLEKGNSYFELNKKKNKLTENDSGITYSLKASKEDYDEFE